MPPESPADAASVTVHWLSGGGEMGKLVRAMDWSKTALGPIESWPQSLRTTVSLCLASNFPISIAWGPQRVQIYNDGYWPICGGKHPHSMGQDFKECWFSAWPAIGEAFERAATGETSFLENRRMFLDRNGYLEETFFTFSFSPIRDETGGVGGLFHPVTELTQQTLAERRLKVVCDLADHTADAQSVAQACTLMAQTLAACDLDLPFVLLYLLDADGTQARLAASTGLAPGMVASPEVVDLWTPQHPSWPLAEVVRSGRIVQVDEVVKQFGPLACGPYPEAPQTALVLPISLAGLAQPFGLLVAGVSARRALDEAYRTFYEMLKDTVTNALTNARAYEKERKRAEATVELHEHKRAEAALREQTEVVETINRVGHTLAAELDLEKLLQAVTDVATALTGAQFGAFFYNVSEAHGESYMLYALSGVPREQFAQFPLPRNTALFAPTFRGTGVVRIPDVKQDPRYGKHAPYYGLPPGHLPVTSYLAVPVVSRSGEVLGGLFFGHPQAGVFTDRHERLVIGLAAQAAVAVDNARLFTAAQHEITERQQLERVLREREQQYRHLVYALPAAVYTCDVQGRITLYNEAAVTLWGRVPEVGKDLWCGSWRIYEPDGTPLPLDQCPMAVALREGRTIRGQEIVIERPDGTRRHVLPYPDPIYNAAGEVVGAVNMLLDLTERQQAEETRERLAALVDSSDDAIIGQTLEGVITSWNRGAERLYGYTAVEVLGQPLSLLIPPDLPDDLPQLLSRLQRGESIDHYETQRLHKDGTRRDVALTISPIRDSTGRIVGASKIARDITERKRAEAALQQAYAELEQRVADRTALLALMHDITVAANAASSPAAALQVAVERICTYTGWPVGHAYLPEPDGTGQWVPTPIWHLADFTRWAVFQQATQAAPVAPGEGLIGRVGATGVPAWSGELRTDLAPWQQHAAVQSGLATGCAVPLLVGQEVVGILAFYAEVRQAPDAALLDALLQLGTQLGRAVERARATEQAHRQQEALFQREKLAAMSTLLASVAHELNNPLATILLQAELVGEDVRGGPLAEPVTEIAEAAVRCERLVRQFLTLARQHPPERAAVTLNTLVAETVELLAYPFRVDNAAVHLRLDDQLPPFWGDPHQLQQVLINLLTNAQQALRAAPGAREVTCTTQYDPAQHRITLAVADTGPGIPLALQARIFEPFFTTKPPGVGTGLGLPLCRGIVEAHGGTLEVTSALGSGATFQITLPVETVPAAPPATPGTAEGFTERGHTILIVEDEQSLATGLARLLRRDGHTVDTAANGRLALARLDERTYDLILCDVRMPELDGPSLYRFLERQQPHLCQRCIFLTGDTLEPATQAFLEQSGVSCLMKPFSIAEARRAIRRAMHLKHPAAPASAPPATRAIDEG